jgi:hypothetical protein
MANALDLAYDIGREVLKNVTRPGERAKDGVAQAKKDVIHRLVWWHSNNVNHWL